MMSLYRDTLQQMRQLFNNNIIFMPMRKASREFGKGNAISSLVGLILVALNLGILHLIGVALYFLPIITKVLTAIIISCLVTIKYGYRGYKRNKSDKFFSTIARKEKVYQLHDLDSIANHGAAGESKAHIEIMRLRLQMRCLNKNITWMPSDDRIDHIILKNGKYTQEIDDLLIVDQTVFVFEVKHWQGKIHEVDGKLFKDGVMIKSPEEQTKNKVINLNKILNAHIKDDQYYHLSSYKIEPVYVFTHDNVELDTNLSYRYVKLNNLAQYMASYRDQHMRKGMSDEQVKSFTYIAQSILYTALDTDKDAKHRHMLQLAEMKDASPDVKQYAWLYQQIINQQNKKEERPVQHISTVNYVGIYVKEWLLSKRNITLMIIITLPYQQLHRLIQYVCK